MAKQHESHARTPLVAGLSMALWLSINGGLAVAVLTTLRLVSKAEQDIFFLYYQPFLPMLAMLWFWGINVRYFERHHVRYDNCFSTEDQRYLLRSGQLFQASHCQQLGAAAVAGCMADACIPRTPTGSNPAAAAIACTPFV